MPTFIPKPADIDRKWFVIDAADVVLGNLATRAAAILTGKVKPIYTPFLDTGDHVVVINASKVHLTGRKEEEKKYYQHSGYLGGMKSQTVIEVRAKKPERLIEDAIRGMLPKTRLGRAMFTKLKVYSGSAHPHQAQKPQPLTIKGVAER